MRESKTLEFKEQVTNTFLKTVCAFANYGTGEIKFGVRDDGTEVGVSQPEKTCLDIENRINDCIVPVPEYTLNIHPKTAVITLRVQEGLHKPYLYKSKAYRRNDTATVEADRLSLTRLILAGQNLSFEELDAQDSELHFSILEEKMRDRLQIEKVSLDVLKTLQLYRNGKYNHAGELLADRNKLPGVDMLRFGDTINIILDRVTCSHVSVLEQYDTALSIYRKYYQFEEITGALREIKELIPEAAFREAVANALVHRTWDVNAHINIAMFADRIEITSPGGLPDGLSEEDYLSGGISILRNPIIGSIFYRLHMIENFGTGIRRINETYRESEKKPIYQITDNSIKITLPVLQEKTDLRKDEAEIYTLLKGRTMSSTELAAASGFGKTKVVSILKRLTEQGYTHSVGNGRATKYTIS
ncbi:MAG: ATP-binding protein [Eubacteriales bacterium]|nr:ATP-binding protein [Eubacteriales bacterium]